MQNIIDKKLVYKQPKTWHEIKVHLKPKHLRERGHQIIG